MAIGNAAKPPNKPTSPNPSTPNKSTSTSRYPSIKNHSKCTSTQQITSTNRKITPPTNDTKRSRRRRRRNRRPPAQPYSEIDEAECRLLTRFQIQSITSRKEWYDNEMKLTIMKGFIYNELSRRHTTILQRPKIQTNNHTRPISLLRSSAIKIQKHYRRRKATHQLKAHKLSILQHRSATIIQKHQRRHLVQPLHHQLLSSIHTLQKHWKQQQATRHRAAIIIQNYLRSWSTHHRFQRHLTSIHTIQYYWRRSQYLRRTTLQPPNTLADKSTSLNAKKFANHDFYVYPYKNTHHTTLVDPPKAHQHTTHHPLPTHLQGIMTTENYQELIEIVKSTDITDIHGNKIQSELINSLRALPDTQHDQPRKPANPQPHTKPNSKLNANASPFQPTTTNTKFDTLPLEVFPVLEMPSWNLPTQEYNKRLHQILSRRQHLTKQSNDLLTHLEQTSASALSRNTNLQKIPRQALAFYHTWQDRLNFRILPDEPPDPIRIYNPITFEDVYFEPYNDTLRFTDAALEKSFREKIHQRSHAIPVNSPTPPPSCSKTTTSTTHKNSPHQTEYIPGDNSTTKQTPRTTPPDNTKSKLHQPDNKSRDTLHSRHPIPETTPSPKRSHKPHQPTQKPTTLTQQNRMTITAPVRSINNITSSTNATAQKTNNNTAHKTLVTTQKEIIEAPEIATIIESTTAPTTGPSTTPNTTHPGTNNLHRTNIEPSQPITNPTNRPSQTNPTILTNHRPTNRLFPRKHHRFRRRHHHRPQATPPSKLWTSSTPHQSTQNQCTRRPSTRYRKPSPSPPQQYTQPINHQSPKIATTRQKTHHTGLPQPPSSDQIQTKHPTLAFPIQNPSPKNHQYSHPHPINTPTSNHRPSKKPAVSFPRKHHRFRPFNHRHTHRIRPKIPKSKLWTGNPTHTTTQYRSTRRPSSRYRRKLEPHPTPHGTSQLPTSTTKMRPPRQSKPAFRRNRRPCTRYKRTQHQAFCSPRKKYSVKKPTSTSRKQPTHANITRQPSPTTNRPISEVRQHAIFNRSRQHVNHFVPLHHPPIPDPSTFQPP